MFNMLRNKPTLAAATFGGVVAITTLLGLGVCAADGNWTITVKNASKVPADVTILSESKTAGSKAIAVRPDGGTATITIPATGPAYKSKYSWKAEYGGKVCGSHSVDISGPTTVIVTCDAAPPASTSSQSKPPADSSSQPKQTGSGTSSAPPAPPNLRLKSSAEMEKEIDGVEKDVARVEEELGKVDSKGKLEELKKQASKDRETINRINTVLNGTPKSVIETNPSDWTVLQKKTTDAGDKVKAVEKRILGCVLAGDATGGDAPGSNVPPPTNIDSGTKGKHVVGCKKDI
ncbi:MAG: hypothetical protein WDN50_10265 [Bradyrhizobium sp.]